MMIIVSVRKESQAQNICSADRMFGLEPLWNGVGIDAISSLASPQQQFQLE
jgi:hypothetical protein